VGRPSPFTVTLTATERRVLQGRLRRPTAQQRKVLRARIVLAAEAEQNIQIAGRLGVAVNTVSKWRKRFSQEGRSGLRDRKRPGRSRRFPSAVVIEVKAIACELPATRGVPLGRWSLADSVTRSIPPA
jgi:transposase